MKLHVIKIFVLKMGNQVENVPFFFLSNFNNLFNLVNVFPNYGKFSLKA